MEGGGYVSRRTPVKGGGRFKRTGTSTLGKPVCHGCGETIDSHLHTRSLRWAFGMPGSHFLYCDPTCRDDHEAEAV